MKRNNSVVLGKTLDHTQSEEQITEIQSEGALLHGVSSIPVTSIVAGKFGNIANKFRLARVAERLVTERDKQGPTLGIIHSTKWTQRSKSECFVARASRKLCRVY